MIVAGLTAIALCAWPSSHVRGGETKAPQFEPDVLPVLARHCLKCHSEKSPKGGLDLRTLPAMLRGGESGEPAVVPGKPEESHLVRLIREGEMPPRERPRLADDERRIIERWIESGARGGGTSPPASIAKRREESTRDQLALQVFDLLDYKCLVCHGPARREAGLDLSTAASAFKGGKSGPAVVKGKSGESRLFLKIRHDVMPPRLARYELSIKPVSEAELTLLARWIDLGAPEFPRRPVLGPAPDAASPADREWWSFRPPRRPAAPRVKATERLRTPIDAFVLARLEKQGLGFSPDADRRMLLRRLSLDLVGLPPTPEEIRRFERDPRPDAYEREVDRLLASPHYGERWGQHWLDAAGYSESDGGDDGDPVRPEFHLYRDYVIRSLNAGKPYDRFLVEQLAGDELADLSHAPALTRELADNLVATGFLRTCVDPTDRPVHNFLADRYQVLAETINVVGSSLMGLTIGCARCHTHKYDPISLTEYYQLSAVFAAAYNPMQWKVPRERRLPLTTQSERTPVEARNRAIEESIKPIERQLAELTASFRSRRFEEKLLSVPGADRASLRAALGIAPDRRSQAERTIVEKLGAIVDVMDDELPAAFPDYKLLAASLRDQVATLRTLEAGFPLRPGDHRRLARGVALLRPAAGRGPPARGRGAPGGARGADRRHEGRRAEDPASLARRADHRPATGLRPLA